MQQKRIHNSLSNIIMNKRNIVVIVITVFLLASMCRPSHKNKVDLVALSQDEKEVFLTKGKKIAGLTFSALSSQLQRAIATSGISGAVQYCSVSAIPITDSLSRANSVVIKRTSEKLRNPANQGSLQETEVLKEYQIRAAKGSDLSPIIRPVDETHVAFYAPIIANDFCLNCHGSPGGEIAQDDLDLITRLYPNDQATGYLSGDLRGIWSIVFPRQL